MNDDRQRRQLILYATPAGPLAEQCNQFFREAASRLGATAAQAYPPHVTLTGFFRRLSAHVPQVVTEISAHIRAVPADAVEVKGLVADQDWLGLRISSTWLTDLTASIVGSHQLTEGDDALRPKDWLHLSLAYGNLGPGREIAEYSTLARQLVDPTADVSWQVALWERQTDGAFGQLKRTPS